MIRDGSCFLFSVQIFFFEYLRAAHGVELADQSFDLFSVVAEFRRQGQAFAQCFVRLFIIDESGAVRRKLEENPLGNVGIKRFEVERST